MKPKNHTLYWVYVYSQTDEYQFDTTTQLAEAKKMLTQLKKELKPARDGFIFYGDTDGAFTNLDPALSWYAHDEE